MRRDSVMTMATILITWLALHFLTSPELAGGVATGDGQPSVGVANGLSIGDATPGPPLALVIRPTSAPGPKIVVVGNTGGDGVGVRREPKEGNRIAALIDGTRLTQLGQEFNADGASWTQVKLGDGREGYVPSRYLLPGPADEGGGASGASVVPELELLASIGRYERGMLLLEGHVRNLGGEARGQVQVVVEWLDAEQRLVTAQTGPLEFDPLPAGGEAPFRIAAPERPGATQYRLNFKETSGAMIPFLDSR